MADKFRLKKNMIVINKPPTKKGTMEIIKTRNFSEFFNTLGLYSKSL